MGEIERNQAKLAGVNRTTSVNLLANLESISGPTISPIPDPPGHPAALKRTRACRTPNRFARVDTGRGCHGLGQPALPQLYVKEQPRILSGRVDTPTV